MTTTTILSAATATGSGNALALAASDFTVQAYGTTSAGSGAATIKIQVSNDGTNWIDLGTITLTLATTASSDGLAAFAAWSWVRANVTAISGTNASVTVTVGS